MVFICYNKFGDVMKTMDNTIKYYELLMKYDDTDEFKRYELPEGFHYEFYKPGDEEEWCKIHRTARRICKR